MAGTPGHRELSAREAELIATLKQNGADFLLAMDACAEMAPAGGRCFALAKTKMEEAVMWATKGLTS